MLVALGSDAQRSAQTLPPRNSHQGIISLNYSLVVLVVGVGGLC